MPDEISPAVNTTKIDETITIASTGIQRKSELLTAEVRAVVVYMFVLTVCVMSFMRMVINEPLYGLAYLAVGYLFGKVEGKQKNLVKS